MILLSIDAFSQGFNEDFEKFKILNSGKTKVEVNLNDKLNQIWHLDTISKTITIFHLVPSPTNLIRPKYNDKYSTEYFEKYFFNKFGNLDSIYTIKYDLLWSLNKSKNDTIIDTIVYKYNYPLLESRPINMKTIKIKIGKRRILRTDIFGYNSEKQLILILQDEGRVPFYYSYNHLRQIEKETVLYKADIYYSYDSNGKLLVRASKNSTVNYEYNDSSLLKTMTIKGKDIEIWTYEYQ